MITKTCFTAGSLELEPPACEPEEPDPVDPPSLGASAAGALAGGVDALAWVVVAGASAGVGASSDGGCSLADDGDEDDGADDVSGAAPGARTTLRGWRAEAASVWFTGEPAAAPSRTPKPRNASTIREEILGDGRDRPAASLGEGAAAPWELSTGSAGRWRASRRSSRSRSRASSCGLRGPSGEPQARQ
jgi:hypothetical protein